MINTTRKRFSRFIGLVTMSCLPFFNYDYSFASDSVNVSRDLQQVAEMRDSGKIDEALVLCDTIRKRMNDLFVEHYNEEIIPVRMEYDAHELKVEADKEFNELLLKCGLGAIALCVVGIGVFMFYRKENKLVAQSEKQMNEAMQKAEIAEKSKSMFLSNMTHEIRTPLNAIAGFSEVLTIPDIDQEMRKESADIINMNSNMLQNLINDVIDTACMDLREMKFRIVACDVVKLCRNVTEMIAKLKKTDAKISFESDEERLVIMVDPLRLQQVLVNVLVNATKFCKQGSIVMRVENEKDLDMVCISVTDTGIGIPRAAQAHIFQRFERVRESAEGFGLGLSISQFIIERFGGKIWVDNQYTGGARFVFTLPYGEQTEEGGRA